MSENPTARQKRGARRRSQKLRSAASLSCALTGSITYSHNMRIERVSRMRGMGFPLVQYSAVVISLAR